MIRSAEARTEFEAPHQWNVDFPTHPVMFDTKRAVWGPSRSGPDLVRFLHDRLCWNFQTNNRTEGAGYAAL